MQLTLSCINSSEKIERLLTLQCTRYIHPLVNTSQPHRSPFTNLAQDIHRRDRIAVLLKPVAPAPPSRHVRKVITRREETRATSWLLPAHNLEDERQRPPLLLCGD